MPVKIIEDVICNDVKVPTVTGTGTDATVKTETIKGLESKINDFIAGKTVTSVTITYAQPKYIATILYAN